MAEAARKTAASLESGWSSHVIEDGSSNVYTNSLKAARVDDPVTTHTNSPNTHSGNKISAGSSKVNINGKAAARKGDAINCGSAINAGSGNVNIGG